LLSIDKSFRFSLKINNTLITDGIFYKCVVQEGVNLIMPWMELSIKVPEYIIEGIAIVDGMQLSVSITSLQNINVNPKDDDWIPFRIFNYNIVPTSDGLFMVKIVAVYDAPFLLQSYTKSIEGTSYDVFSNIANLAKLQFEGDVANDKQKWLCPGPRAGIFLKSVERRAWSSNLSCYVSALRRDGTLILYNLYERGHKGIVDWSLGPELDNTADKNLYVDSITPSSSSGTLNSHHGYGRSYNYFDPINEITDGAATFKFTELYKTTSSFQMASDLRKNQGSNTYNANAGNTHNNYQQAEAQNTRFKSMNSVKVACRTPFLKNVKLLQRVNLIYPSNARGNYSQEMYSGVYFVDKISTVIIAPSPVRYISLIRDGLNPLYSNNNTLVS